MLGDLICEYPVHMADCFGRNEKLFVFRNAFKINDVNERVCREA